MKNKENNKNEKISLTQKIKIFHTKLFILIILYLLDCIINLITCIYSHKIIRRTSKIFLMPLLCLIYIELNTKNNLNKYYIIGMLLGAVGDIVLMCPDDSPLVLIGGGCFALGHILYIIAIFEKIGLKNFINNFLIFIAILILMFGNLYYQYIYYLKEWFINSNNYIGLLIYFFIIVLISAFSLLYFYFGKNFYSFILFLGALFFWKSDFILIKMMYYDKNLYLGLFYVMLYYLIAQTCITIGMSKEN